MGQDGATCVAVEVRPSARPGLLRLVEGALGWQAVDPDDDVLPAACVLVDVTTAAQPTGLPRVLVVDAADGPRALALAARGVDAVVGPDPRADELVAAVAGLAPARRVDAPWRVVASSAGGVGATTVAAAIAGLRAWQGDTALLVASGPTHVPDAPVVEGRDLASPAVWEAAAPATALPELRVVGWRPGAELPAVAHPRTVVEIGDTELGLHAVDVLVVRPDEAGRAAVVDVPAAPCVVVVGGGPLPVRAVVASAGGPVVHVPWSARVARATAVGRLPAGLPGRWLGALAPLVGDAQVRP